MPMYSYDLQNVKRDLSDTMNTVNKDEPLFISKFPRVRDAKAKKHEWLEDQIGGRGITATAATSGGVLTVSAADAAKVSKGTLVSLKDDTAVFQVAEVSGTSVTLALVGANGSTLTAATLPTSGGVYNIISAPKKEGSRNGDGDEGYHQTGKDYNTTMILRKDIVLTRTNMSVEVYGKIDNQIERQTAFQLQQLARDMNRIALFGPRRVEGSQGTPGEAAGLYFFATQPGCLSINGGGNIFDSFIVNDAGQATLNEGCFGDTILCHPSQGRVLSNERKAELQILRADDVRGSYVARIVNDTNGKIMTIIADPDMPNKEAFVMDCSGFGLSYLQNGGVISDEDVTEKGFDGIMRRILTEFTFEFINAKQRICRVYNLMEPATALAKLKAKYDGSAETKVTVANTEDNPIPTKAITA